MAEYTPKAFAVGEILTAQDVNEYLVNHSSPIYFEDPDQILSAREFDLSDGFAMIERLGDAPFHRVTFRLRFLAVPRADGGQNSPLGTMAPGLRPMGATPVSAYSANNLSNVSIQSSGLIALRWSSASSTGSALNINGTYLAAIE